MSVFSYFFPLQRVLDINQNLTCENDLLFEMTVVNGLGTAPLTTANALQATRDRCALDERKSAKKRWLFAVKPLLCGGSVQTYSKSGLEVEKGSWFCNSLQFAGFKRRHLTPQSHQLCVPHQATSLLAWRGPPGISARRTCGVDVGGGILDVCHESYRFFGDSRKSRHLLV